MHFNVKDLTGSKFGRLTVLSHAGSTAEQQSLWECRCRCGQTVVLRGANLVRGFTKSCGCLQREATANANRTHGRSDSREYYIWRSMKQRCETHPDYAGRGIEVCDRWLSFEAFYADMGPSPGIGYTIDRIKNDEGYYPGNCRWVPQLVNNRNKRNNHRLQFNGQDLCLSEWADVTGIPASTIKSRLCRGWSVEAALTAQGRRPG